MNVFSSLWADLIKRFTHLHMKKLWTCNLPGRYHYINVHSQYIHRYLSISVIANSILLFGFMHYFITISSPLSGPLPDLCFQVWNWMPDEGIYGWYNQLIRIRTVATYIASYVCTCIVTSDTFWFMKQMTVVVVNVCLHIEKNQGRPGFDRQNKCWFAHSKPVT